MVTHLINYIVSDPDIRRGRPRINGTGITVHNIADDYNNGMTVQEISEAFDLTPSQIHAALAYYYDHKAQIDSELREEEQRSQQFIARYGAESAESRRRVEDRLRKIKDNQSG
jgi:uncharacterized protein (DUF433 family)